MNIAQAYTDGSCKGNPGPGGWAANITLSDSSQTFNISGGEDHTTNNRMEMLAVIKALEWFISPTQLEICLDSTYVMNGATKWMYTWAKRNWKKPDGNEDVVNADLWVRLHEQITRRGHTITFTKVKAHSGVKRNELVDFLAKQAIPKVKNTPKKTKSKQKARKCAPPPPPTHYSFTPKHSFIAPEGYKVVQCASRKVKVKIKAKKPKFKR